MKFQCARDERMILKSDTVNALKEQPTVLNGVFRGKLRQTFKASELFQVF